MFRNLFAFITGGKSESATSSPANPVAAGTESVSKSQQVEWQVGGESIAQRFNPRRTITNVEPTGFTPLGTALSKTAAFNENLGDRAARLKRNAASADNFSTFDAMINPQYAPMSEVLFTQGPAVNPAQSDETVQLSVDLDEVCAVRTVNEQILLEEIRQIGAKLRFMRSGAQVLQDDPGFQLVTNEMLDQLCVRRLTAIAKDVNTPTSALRELALTGDVATKRILAGNPFIAVDTMWLLARDEDLETRRLMADNRSVPLEILESLAHDHNPQVSRLASSTMAVVGDIGSVVTFPQRRATDAGLKGRTFYRSVNF